MGCEVHAGVGGTGVAAIVRNGEGPVVVLRADMDALPVREATGLPYASSVTATGGSPVMAAVLLALAAIGIAFWARRRFTRLERT